MNSKKSFWDWYWDLSLKVAVLGMALSPFVVGGIYFYNNYIKPEPIDELYCYCLTTENKVQLAKLHRKKSEAITTSKKILNGYFDNQVSDRISLGDKVLVYRYSEDSIVAKIDWVRKSISSGTYSNSGWVPSTCLQKSPPKK